nr:MAG TPA: tail protein [Caudoviricetes sp.]
MHSMGYTSAVTHKRHDMQCARIVGGEPGAMRTDSWDYDTGYRDLSHATRKARKETITVAMLDLAVADTLRLAADADLASMTPGTLDFNNWTQRCYIAGVEAKAVTWGAAVIELEVVLLDGVWRKKDLYEFRPGAGSGTVGVGHGYDYGYAYGYPYSEETSREIDAGSIVASPFRIIIYGPAVRPSVTVAGNRYQVLTDVPDGGYLLIDSIEGTVTKVAKNGYKTNALPDAVLGGGVGSGSYIFEDIPAGTSTVSYDGSFGWDLEVYREDGAVPWTSS